LAAAPRWPGLPIPGRSRFVGGRRECLPHLAGFRSAWRARFSPTCGDREMLSSRFSRVATSAVLSEPAADASRASSVLRAIRRDIPPKARQPCRTEPVSRLPPVTDHAPRSFHHAAFRYRPIRASAAWPDVRSSPTHPAALLGFIKLSLAGLLPQKRRPGVSASPGPRAVCHRHPHPIVFIEWTGRLLLSSVCGPTESEMMLVRLPGFVPFRDPPPRPGRKGDPASDFCLLQGCGHALCTQSEQL
jgi:hypothetical protein